MVAARTGGRQKRATDSLWGFACLFFIAVPNSVNRPTSKSRRNLALCCLSKFRLDYSITSSARASSVAGTSRLSAFAVLRLITSSYLVGWSTGKSAGLAPLRIRPA